MRTKTVTIDGEEITIAKLTLDRLEEWEEGIAAGNDVGALAKRMARAAIERAGKTAPEAVSRMDVDGLAELIREVTVFSYLVSRPGEEVSP